MSKKLLYAFILIVIATATSILTYAWVVGPEVPTASEWQTWLLQTIVYLGLLALFTCVLGPLAYRHYSEYRERRKQERSEEESKLASKIKGYKRSISQIEYNIKERVKKDDFKYSADIQYSRLSSEAEGKIKRYIENYYRCRDWFDACKYVINSILETHTKSKLPETRKKYTFDHALQSDDFTKMFVNGEKVTSNWLKENKPKIYQQIKKSFRESEGEEKLDMFFLDVNKEFEWHSILKRFRNEKKALIEHGFEITKNLKEELKSFES